MKMNKQSINRKIKIAQGQLDGILKMIEKENYYNISNLIQSTQGLLKSIHQEIIYFYIIDSLQNNPSLTKEEEKKKKYELLNLLKKFIS